MEKKPFYKNVSLWFIASLTLGLAPFNPPHLFGKIEWLLGGGAISGDHPMQFMDWFDLFLHGTPWVLLIVSVVFWFLDKRKGQVNPR